MDTKIFSDIADTVVKIKMFPYFDMAHYTLMSMAVREDTPQTGFQAFSRRHPLACWLATMLMCFSGAILANLLTGEPVLTPFKDHESIVLATIVWYLINYSPFDVVYKITRLLPVKLVICILKEAQRTRKIHDGVAHAYKIFPNAYIICVIIGVVKGAGSSLAPILSRMIYGATKPPRNEYLHPSFTTKASIAVAIIFLLEKLGKIPMLHNQLYLAATAFLIYFRITSLLLGIHDPFVPFENLFCAIFMGGLVDALRRAFERPSALGTSPGHTHPGAPGYDSATDAAARNKPREEKKNE